MRKWWFVFGCIVIGSCVAGNRLTNKKITVTKNSLDFIVLGDWGKKGNDRQLFVARELAIAAKTLNADFIISTGDNFYYEGVSGINDNHWQRSFENVYLDAPLQKKWYIVLGNHDYMGSVAAQIEYTNISNRWYLPSRYYSKNFFINDDTTQQVLIAFIDTNPFVKNNYTDRFFQDSIRLQDSSAQKIWLQNVLSDTSSSIKWKIVVGHHPISTGGSRIEAREIKEMNGSLNPIFEKYNVDAYIAGHEHHLEHTKPAGSTHYFISGAGAQKKPASINPQGGLFTASDQGFIAFSILKNKMVVQMINDRGKVLYKKSITK